MSKYVRKTHDEYVIFGDQGYGKEFYCYAEDRADARRTVREYRENEVGRFWIVRKRIPNSKGDFVDWAR